MKKTVIYLVKILRVDDITVDLVETEEFSKAKKTWESAYLQWTNAVAERKPFVVDKPVNNQPMIAFDPSLIKEIGLFPIDSSIKFDDNPYSKKMRSEGLSSMLGNSNMTDGGYL